VIRTLSLWLPVVVYMAAIFYLSSLQHPPVPADIPDVRLHAVAYFGLMVVVARAIAQGTWARVTGVRLGLAWLITVLYGASDEWHQMYVPTRTAELHDLIADAIGAFAAGISLKAWVIIRRL
jgi:VanZ family protein